MLYFVTIKENVRLFILLSIWKCVIGICNQPFTKVHYKPFSIYAVTSVPSLAASSLNEPFFHRSIYPSIWTSKISRKPTNYISAVPLTLSVKAQKYITANNNRRIVDKHHIKRSPLYHRDCYRLLIKMSVYKYRTSPAIIKHKLSFIALR